MRDTQPTAVAPAHALCDGVVLLHGIGVGSWTLKKLDRALQRRGFATLNLDYSSRKKPLEALAEEIHPPIAAFAEQCGGAIHFVAHSMGGLLTRVYLSRRRPARLGRVVMLGTPNGGSEVADLLKDLSIYRAVFGPAGLQLSTTQDPVLADLPLPDYAIGVIAGCRTIAPIASALVLPRPNDGRVSVASTKLAGIADHTIVKASHTRLPRHNVAIGQTIAFLHDGRFSSA
ncbi:alpha/beta fold hydrolase [Bradyrhizobium diazoefficiens]|uniref:alpha/beta fold hydrolase n=1 Tax=Bradyrhizobium diazoefficiens TaxID=1355477 RepID=UPI00190C6C2E|nr:alpha/beta fold hydrolase [Bradyrhizobium diazoefficiens]MBK3665420.1 alpha/beta fold hydrolase [Bradyrhizobium diazoefficiens]